MRAFLIRPSDLGPVEIAAWQSMQRSTPSLANPFLTPEFAAAVGRFRPMAHVAVLTEGQSTAGFFPFERRRLGSGVPICGWLTPCPASSTHQEWNGNRGSSFANAVYRPGGSTI